MSIAGQELYTQRGNNYYTCSLAQRKVSVWYYYPAGYIAVAYTLEDTYCFANVWL